MRLYSWLGYTSKLDGCLCLPCCLFGSDGGNAKIFVEKPYSNWTALNQKLKLHSTCPTHVKCSLAMKSFKDAHAGVQPTIDTTMNKHRQEQYDLNCNRLDAIIDCVWETKYCTTGTANCKLSPAIKEILKPSCNLELLVKPFKSISLMPLKCTVYMPRYTKRNNFFNLQAFDLGQIVKASGRNWGVFCHL